MPTDATRPTDDEVREALEWYADPIAYAITQAAEPRSAVHGDAGRRARAILDRLTTPQPHIAAEPGEVERVAKALYQCEKERSDHVDRLLSAAKGQPVKFRMEHWDDVADLYRSDARAALATLTAPEPRAAGEGAMVDAILALVEKHIVKSMPLATLNKFTKDLRAALRQPSTDRESVPHDLAAEIFQRGYRQGHADGPRLFDAASMHEGCAQMQADLSERFTERESVRKEAWPDELTNELRNILGRQCFTFITLSQVYRKAGHDIPTSAEDEQAFFLHRFLGHWFRHGAGWMDAANADIAETKQAALKASSKGGDHGEKEQSDA